MSFAPVDGERAIVLYNRDFVSSIQTGSSLGNLIILGGYIYGVSSSKKGGASRYLTVSKMFNVKCTLCEDLSRNLKCKPDTCIKNRYIFVILELRTASL